MLNFLGLKPRPLPSISPRRVGGKVKFAPSIKECQRRARGSLYETIINIKKQFHPLGLRKGLASIYADVLFEI